jgi:glycosyltransferase involved in cell wall biosynthesis
VKHSDLSDNKLPPIVCFAGSDWWYHNRGLFVSQIMPRMAKHTRVLFINSLGMRVPNLKKDPLAVTKILRKIRSIARFIRKDISGMYVMSPVSLPLLGSALGRTLNTYSVLLQTKLIMLLLGIKNPIFYIGCPPARDVAERIKHKYLIYERTDLFEEMPGANKPYIASLDNELTESADLVLYANELLFKQGINKNKNSLLIGHGVDFELFASAEQSNYVPADIAAIPRPIIGYFGDICDKTFDFELMCHLAMKLPQMSFVLIGPLSSDVNCLKKFRNVRILGQKRYEDIPHYGKVFDVSILPWKKNTWVMHSYPVKIKEYLAMGKPFVSVDIPAARTFESVVCIADDYDDFVLKLRQAVEDKDPQAKQRRRESVESETWDSKVSQIINFIKERGRSFRTSPG